MPIGTLTRKIQCQLSTSVSTPPSSTPIDAAAGRDEAEDAHRLGALGRLGEEAHHQRERDRRDDRPAEPLDGPRRDQELLRAGEPARDRSDREQRDPDQEHAPVPVEVAEPPAEEQEAAEGEQVGVDDPRERRLGEPEIGPDRRQRDVHDRRVEDDHQSAGAEDEECEPTVSGVHGGHRVSPFGGSGRNGVFERSDRPGGQNSSVGKR